MSHVQLLLNMVSAHKDDLELWVVDEIKTGTVTRITKLASDAYIQGRKRTWWTRAWRRLATWGTVMGDSSEEAVHDWGTVVKRQSTT